MTVALHGNAYEAFWAGTSFLLTSMVWQPNFVAFSHLWGRRPLLLLALTFFTVGSIVCAVSKNFTMMLVGRSIQGTGGGGIIALTEILITDMVPLRERGNYFALISIVWAIGSVAGPLVGGALAQAGAWRWMFYLNLPIVAIGFAGIIAFLKLESRKLALKQKLLELDYLGSVIFLASSTSFLVGITWGGVMYAWSSWHTLVPIIVGLFGLSLFVIYEAKFATYTLLPLGIFRNKDTNIAYFLTWIHGIILWSILYYMPLFFEGAQDFTPILAGVSALPQSLTVVPCAALVGVISAKTGNYRWALWLGWTLTTLGVGLLYLLSPTTTIPAWIFLMLVSGIGIGLLFPAMALAIQASAPPKDIAIAAAMFTFFRCFGQTIGVAIGGVVFQNRMAANLAGYPSLSDSAVSYSLNVVSLIRQINAMPDADPTKTILKTALAHSIRPIWALMCGLAGLALMTTVFIKGYDLDQKLATEQGFEGQEKKNLKEGVRDPEMAATVESNAVVFDKTDTDAVTVDVSNLDPSTARREQTDVAADYVVLEKTAGSKEQPIDHT
jgi:EmrB/QacA subfamily drug resistance transporter